MIMRLLLATIDKSLAAVIHCNYFEKNLILILGDNE